MFGWVKKPRNLVWTGDVLIDARTDEVLARVRKVAHDDIWEWERRAGYWSSTQCYGSFLTKDGAKKFVEEKFR